MVDFHRINHVQHVFVTDYDTYKGREVESRAFLPLRWTSAVMGILDLPVPTYVEPAPVSGEIDVAARRTKDTVMAWGNNNGQGNGYGQGQSYGQDDVYGRLNNTREIGGARFPFIEGGKHKLAVVTLEEFMHSSDGPSVRGLFKVLESTTHKPGSYVVKIWKLVKPPKYNTQPSDGDKFADFCRKLKNAPISYPIGNDIRVLMKERARDQLARGSVIEATGVPNKKGDWIEVYWNAVEGQTPEMIAQLRASIEQEGVPNTSGGPNQQQGYQQAPAQQQYAPPAQQAYQPQPMQQAPVQYQQQAPAQQYAPPVAPQQQAPQGGFLAQLPPPNGNGNPQGGNGGGGW